MYKYFDIRGNTIRLAGNTVALTSAIKRISFEQEAGYVAEYITLKSLLDDNGERVRFPLSSDKKDLTENIKIYRVERERDKFIFKLTSENGQEVYTGLNITSDTEWDLHYDLKNLVEKGNSHIAYKFKYIVRFQDMGAMELVFTEENSTTDKLIAHKEQVAEELYQEIDMFFGVKEPQTKIKNCYIKD